MVKVTDINAKNVWPKSTKPNASDTSNVSTNNVSNVQNSSRGTWPKINTDPLWKQAIDVTKSDWKQAGKEWNQMKDNLTLTPEVKPVDAVEETAWGWNYWLDRAVSQADNQQWHYNALVGTGHVVWMPTQQWVQLQQTVAQQPAEQGVNLVDWTRDKLAWRIPQQWEQEQTAPTPNPTSQWKAPQAKTNQNVSTQGQPQADVATPAELEWLDWGESIEEAQQKVQVNEQAIANMESDLMRSTGGYIYGKVTADQSNAIRTMADENSVYKSMNEARISNFKSLQTMSSDAIAASVISWVMATDSQQMRDLMQYDPAKYQEVQQQIKAIRWQMNINAITSWDGDFNTIATNWQSWISNEIANFATSNSNWITSSADILKSVNSTLSSNVSASTAQEQMWMIENDMVTLQNRLKNLKKEASTVFKWDVPQYIVNAYISNRTAEIQDQLWMLEQRYNAAYSRYQNEWEQTKWAAEFDLKKQQLDIQRQNAYYDNWATQQWILQWWAKIWWTANTNVTTTTLTREQISTSIDDLVTACENWQLWNAQCAAWVQQYYFPTLWVNLWSLSAYSAKQGICNELAWDYLPQKWDVVVMSSNSAPEYWHMGIVIWVDGDTLTYLDWNGSVENWVGTEKPAIRTTKLSNWSIYGYYNPTKSRGYYWESWDGYFNPNYAEIYGNFLRWKYSAWKQLETTAQSLWITIDELRNQANAWKNSQTNSVDVQERLDALEYLLRDSDLWRLQRQAASSNTWAWEINRFIFSEAWDFNSSYKFIKDNITFDKLLELKRWGATFWALSDNELRAIGNSATRLHTSMDKDTWDKTLLSIYNWLRKGIWESEVTMEQIKSWEISNGWMWWDAFKNPTGISWTQYSVTDILSI